MLEGKKVADQNQGLKQPNAAPQQEGLLKGTLDPKSEDLTQAAQHLVAALAEAVKAEAAKPGDGSSGNDGQNVVTLEEGFGARDTYTIKASEITRQLGLAGLAIIWIFKTTLVDSKTGQAIDYSVPPDLVPVGLMLIIGLTLDFLHYIVGGVLWQWYTKDAQRKGQEEFNAPTWINFPTWTIFVAKVIIIVASYVYLIVYLANKWIK